MKRAALVAAILLSSLPATAQQLWQNQQNVNGFCAAPVGNATLLPLVQADGTIACLTPVTSSTVPIFNGTTVVWSTVPPSGITPGTVGQVLLTGVGPVVVWGNFSTGLTVASNVVTANLSTGIAGGQSVIGGTAATDTLTIKSTSATPTSGSRIYFQTAFTGDYYDPVVGTFGMSAGSTVLSMFKPGDQFLLKTVGNLTVGTNDAHSTIIRTNGANAIVADSSQGVTFPALAGGGTQCVQVDNTGKVGTTGSACGSGGLGGASGTVTNVTGTPPIFITGTPAATPNVTIQGAITSGSTSTSAQNIGVIATAPLACSTAAGVCTVTGMTVGGGLSFNASTAAETLGSFACGTHQFVNQSSTSGLACVQPAFTDLSGSASCGQTPAFSGDLSSAGGTCSVSVVGVESAATVKGYLATNVVVAPSTPSTGVANLYVDSTSDNFCSKNSLGLIDHGIQSNAGLANKWVSAIADDGTVTLSQPAFSNLTGSATCAQLPALTGDITTSAGSCATTNPTKGKVLVSGSDTTPDYLANKVESTGGSIAVTTVGSGSMLNINVLSNDLITFFVSVPSLQAVNTANQQIATSSPTPFSSGVITDPIEVPADFTVKHVYLQLYLLASIGSASSVDVWATKNGTLISGTDINFTPGTTTAGTIFNVGPIATGSSSSSDTYGIQQVYNGNVVTGPFGAQLAYSLKYRLVGY